MEFYLGKCATELLLLLLTKSSNFLWFAQALSHKIASESKCGIDVCYELKKVFMLALHLNISD